MHRGRVSLVQLRDEINIDMAHVARVAREVVAAAPELILLEATGEIVSIAYLDTAASNVGDMLRRRGRMSMGEAATNLDLPVAFVSYVPLLCSKQHTHSLLTHNNNTTSHTHIRRGADQAPPIACARRAAERHALHQGLCRS